MENKKDLNVAVVGSGAFPLEAKRIGEDAEFYNRVVAMMPTDILMFLEGAIAKRKAGYFQGLGANPIALFSQEEIEAKQAEKLAELRSQVKDGSLIQQILSVQNASVQDMIEQKSKQLCEAICAAEDSAMLQAMPDDVLDKLIQLATAAQESRRTKI